MKRLPTREENPRGLHQRYIVTNADGSPVDPGAIFFVLRLDDGCRSEAHTRASRAAAIQYANRVLLFGDEQMKPVAHDLLDLIVSIESDMT